MFFSVHSVVYSYKTVDFRNCEKSTCVINRLNLGNGEKSTLAGHECLMETEFALVKLAGKEVSIVA